MNSQNLVAHTIPLSGKHLIEASAGTGKTFNITRIYLRLLLEKRLTVEQILVMTFTKDATEEIRGRIDAFIRQSLNDWDSLILTDEYYQAIATHIAPEEAKILLKQALLYLDEASIFTIHGFCKRVLSQHAFSSGQPFNLALESDCNDVTLESCQDWYRILAQESPQNFLLVSEFWSTPHALVKQFSKAISQTNALDLIDEQTVVNQFVATVRKAVESLTDNLEALTVYLVDVKKGAEREKRMLELTALVEWLEQLVSDLNVVDTKIPDAFIDGKRYSKSVHKAELLSIFDPVKQVKSSYKDLKKKINKAKALSVVRAGIYTIRKDVEQKKLDRNLVSFDDLISRLANQLSQQSSNDISALSELLFKQFPVALVDEFQDTDPQQFTILKSIYFSQESSAIYMIGDPKQAIYGFRGGDVFAYLAARSSCDYTWVMDTNWRSSQSMVQGYNRLFYGNHLDDAPKNVFNYNIDYVPVNSCPNAFEKERVEPQRTALQFVHFMRDEASKKSVPQSHRKVMATWCANEIVDLFASSTKTPQELTPSDIAILVRDGAEAEDIKVALANAGLDSVYLSNRANLLHSNQATQLIQILKGILFVENDRTYSVALTSELLGYTPQRLYELQQDDFAWQHLKLTFVQLRDEWEQKGFVGMALKLLHEHIVEISNDKARVLTNLLHIFELLQSASQRYKQPRELLHWFEEQTRLDNPEIEAELRLESDENLIRIVTQHGAKGLEYPVVFIPFATRHKDPLKFGTSNVTFIEYHDENGNLKLCLDGTTDAKQAMANEAYAEAVRLLYVAVTRAEQRCYVLTTEFDKYDKSPLGLTLNWSSDTDITTSIIALTLDNPNDISMITVDSVEEIRHAKLNQESDVSLSTETFNGKIERDWWLSSFSALSRNLKHKGISTPDRDTDSQLISLTESSDLHISNQLRFVMEKGARTGNLLHNILEIVAFDKPDWENAFEWPLTKYGEFTPGYEHLDLQHWLEQVLNTPLMNNETKFSLNKLNSGSSLRESEFYFPMNAQSAQELTKLLTTHRKNTALEQSENYNSYVQDVQLPYYQKLKGMMHGFIDLIFEQNGKFYVCDYKSTFLGDNFEAYNQSAMREDIEKHHYDLQYLIYSLALHRYLKSSLPNYEPAQHFGGIYYLYLRGMTNNNEESYGVYSRQITVEELSQLDSVFDGGVDE